VSLEVSSCECQNSIRNEKLKHGKLDDEPKEMIIVWTHEYCAIDKQIRRHNVYTRMRGARFSAQLYLSS
jgi:hypothetical protein